MQARGLPDLYSSVGSPAQPGWDAVFHALATPLLLLQPGAPDFHVLDANRALSALVGIDRGMMLGRGYFDLFYPEPPHLDDAAAALRRTMQASLERVLATCAPDAMPVQRYNLTGPDGRVEERYWIPTNTPILNAGGHLTGIAQHLQDVTAFVELTRASDAAATRSRAEARLRRVFQQAPVGYAILGGPEHRFESANPRYLEMVGERPILGRTIREALPELAGTGFYELVDHVLATGQAQYLHEQRLHLDRTNAPAEGVFTFVLEPVRDAAEAIEGVAIMGIEVTEVVGARETAERMAAEQDTQRRQFQTVLEQSPVGVAIGDAATGRLVFLNRKVHEVFGHERGAETLQDYGSNYAGFHPDGRRLTSGEWAMARALTAGEVVEGEVLEIERLDGGRRTVRINAAPVRDGDERIIAGVVMLQDITAERRLERQLRDAQRLQSVGTLAGGVAHEVNNALQVTLGFGTFVLQALGPTHPQAPDMRVALQSAERAARVSQQLLAFARQQVTQPLAVDLYTLVADLRAVLQQLLGADKPLAVAPPTSRPVIHADPAQVQQVLINLVANARDASETGATVTIAVDEVLIPDQTVSADGIALTPGRYGRLTVNDQGAGMDAPTLARAFEPFFTTKAVGEGTGLGLSMVYGIVKQHGGYVWARSATGVGTTIEIHWPVATAPSSPGAHAAAGAPLSRSGPPRHHFRPVVLVVEDEPLVRALAARILEQEGYQVVDAEDGQVALELLDSRAVCPDLVITDVVMPRLNGRQLSDAVGERWPGLPVLFISGHLGDDAVVQRLVPAGAAFLQKPFTPEALAKLTAELIAKTTGHR
jgi:PAS domain S-box-containing protein